MRDFIVLILGLSIVVMCLLAAEFISDTEEINIKLQEDITILHSELAKTTKNLDILKDGFNTNSRIMEANHGGYMRVFKSHKRALDTLYYMLQGKKLKNKASFDPQYGGEG